MPRTDLFIHACEAGGFMVYGPTEEAQAFVRNGPVRPLAAFGELGKALAFIAKEMDPPRTDRSQAEDLSRGGRI